MENPVDKKLLKEAIKASNSLQAEIFIEQSRLRATCDPSKCSEAFLQRRWGLGIYVCPVCDRR